MGIEQEKMATREERSWENLQEERAAETRKRNKTSADGERQPATKRGRETPRKTRQSRGEPTQPREVTMSYNERGASKTC